MSLTCLSCCINMLVLFFSFVLLSTIFILIQEYALIYSYDPTLDKQSYFTLLFYDRLNKSQYS